MYRFCIIVSLVTRLFTVVYFSYYIIYSSAGTNVTDRHMESIWCCLDSVGDMLGEKKKSKKKGEKKKEEEIEISKSEERVVDIIRRDDSKKYCHVLQQHF